MVPSSDTTLLFMSSTLWTVPKERRPARLMSPAFSPAFVNASVNVAHSAAANTRQMRRGVQCEAASSSTKSTPPTGAPKAAAMPAPAPAQMNSRRSLSLWKRRKREFWILVGCGRRQHRNLRSCFSLRVSPDAMPAPMWIIGASCPHAIPLATDMIVPTTLTKIARSRRKSRMCVPFKYALISGMPPAAAAGSSPTVRPVPMATRARL
mmetsp:Transcript_58362/g.137377  ORF Transcript_58362/g.137377 Transcript_58362/m.137377 type:complete len:208 (+) Transcript_58362:900-1523(+)